MTKYDLILKKETKNIKKALAHLKYSFDKIQKLSYDIDALSQEDLAWWESFIARFSRVSDIFVSKYIRIRILRDNPDFKGSLRDLLNQAEKLNLIESSEQWLEITDLRNRSIHDYGEEDEIEGYFKKIKKLTYILLKIEKII